MIETWALTDVRYMKTRFYSQSETLYTRGILQTCPGQCGKFVSILMLSTVYIYY